ncbi:chemotaxis protein [Waterburya agarophytonicola K14]|uniref:Chemotaxis protein n=1 Tax=Waterburya agarophytonicola KI4 TaxID=2874699 RepID=A0A964FF35_9CYAN|nr:methyl-accepting chemotaxis protein [Waterburya agarophytonicola]MCC0176592.1 chemotaxis protein [Waterburya agarophytonicola KI4]
MKIGTQLIAGAVTIGTAISLNLGVVFLTTSTKDAKVINNSGVVRGATQRSIKLELSQTPNDELIGKLDKLIDSLINGNEELGLSRATNLAYITAMEEAKVQWNKSKELIQQIRRNPTETNRQALLAESEKLFELTNLAVNAAEEYSTEKVQQLRTIQIFVTVFNFIIVVAIIGGARRISRTLSEFTNNIALSTTDIASKVERQEQVANEQSSSVSKTTSTVDTLGETSRRSAIQAEESAKNASTALTLAESGAETVEQTRVGMESLKERVREIAEQIINLSEQTEQIAGVSELVGDLASQTNMLALNAAVEAARAGEYGKGFGVVAGEIRKLADQSRKSADKINNLVIDVQAAMNSAVMVTDEGKKTAESSIELALDTAESFIGVKDAINNVFANTSEISNTAKQQAVGIQEILAAVNALNLGAMDTAADMGDVKNSTIELKKSADELKAIV